MKILLTILIIVTFVTLYPLVNKFITQVIFKSKKRTQKVLLEGYNFYKKEYPNASEKELLLYTMQATFYILNRDEYPKKPYSTKPKYILTEDNVNQIIEKAENIENLIEIAIKKGLSPDMAPLF